MVEVSGAIGEQIRLDDNITLTILGKKGRHIRIGVDAPENIDVHRLEIFERIQEKDDSS